MFGVVSALRELRQSIFHPQSGRMALLAYPLRKFGSCASEYNNILHQNSSAQAHFGRSGLHMLSYDPSEADSMLYMFDAAGRAEAKAASR